MEEVDVPTGTRLWTRVCRWYRLPSVLVSTNKNSSSLKGSKLTSLAAIFALFWVGSFGL